MVQAEKDGVNMGKEWHAKMVNTRDSHADLNGARVPLHEPFHTIWGNDLMYPGDPSAPANEVINCHCGIRPVVLRPGEVLQPTPAPSGKVASSGGNGIIEAKKSIVLESISSGKVSKNVNAVKQNRHIRSSVDYSPGRSYLFAESLEEAQQLIDKLHGKGELVFDRKGNWVNKERVKSESVIGVAVDIDGNEAESHVGMIVYSKTGAHIYPAKEGKE